MAAGTELPQVLERGKDGFFDVIIGFTDDRRHVVVVGNGAQTLLHGDEITNLNSKPTLQLSHQAFIRRIRGRDRSDIVIKRYAAGSSNVAGIKIQYETSLQDPSKGLLRSVPASPLVMTQKGLSLPGTMTNGGFDSARLSNASQLSSTGSRSSLDANDGYIAVDGSDSTNRLQASALQPVSARRQYADLDDRSSTSSFEGPVSVIPARLQDQSAGSSSSSINARPPAGGMAWSSASSASSVNGQYMALDPSQKRGSGNGIAPISSNSSIQSQAPLLGTGTMRLSELEDENSRLVGVIESMQGTASEFMSKLGQAEEAAKGQVAELANTNSVLQGELQVAHTVMEELQHKITTLQEELADLKNEPVPAPFQLPTNRFLPPTTVVKKGAGSARSAGISSMVSPDDDFDAPFGNEAAQVDNDMDPHTELLELLNELRDFDTENESLKEHNRILKQSAEARPMTMNANVALSESATMEVITNDEGHLDFTVVDNPDGGAVVGIVDEGSPADFSGLVPGARFQMVNGLDTKESTADEVLTMLTQVEGLNCEIQVSRGTSRMLMMPKLLNRSLGFRLDGPSKELRNDVMQPHIDNIYIVQVDGNSPADVAGMKVGDRVMWINGVATRDQRVPKVVEHITGADEAVVMRVVHDPVGLGRQKRSKKLAKQIKAKSTYNKKKIRKIEIVRDDTGSFGLKLKGPKTEGIPEHATIAGVHVSEITPGQPADLAGLGVADRILIVNGTGCQGMGFAEVASLFKGQTAVVLKVFQDVSGFKTNLRAIGADTDWVDSAVRAIPSSPMRSSGQGGSDTFDPTTQFSESPATEIISMAVNEFHTSLSFGGGD